MDWKMRRAAVLRTALSISASRIGAGKPTAIFSRLIMIVFFSAVRKPGSRNSFSKLSMPTQGLPKKPSFIL